MDKKREGPQENEGGQLTFTIKNGDDESQTMEVQVTLSPDGNKFITNFQVNGTDVSGECSLEQGAGMAVEDALNKLSLLTEEVWLVEYKPLS